MEKMKIKDKLKTFKQKFDPKLLKFLSKKQKQGKKLAPGFQQSIQEIKRLTKAGGKRLRPLMIYTSCKACNGKENKELWQACMAMSLIQSFALIHDDIMDNAKVRRGQITSYKKLGLNKALLIGDVALILADELVTQKCKKYFGLMKWDLAAGQWLDIKDDHTSKVKSKDTLEVLNLMDLKTARYTIARPLQIGASLANANPKTINTFFSYGKKLGIAFQIQDDILGVFGDPKTTGKPVGADIREGKKTLLIAESLKKITTSEVESKNTSEVKNFKKVFGNPNATEKEIQWIVNLMIKYGILDKAKAQAKKLVNQANKELKNLKINKKEKEFLQELGEYIIKREK